MYCTDCRIPGKIYRGKRNKSRYGKTCKAWEQVTANEIEYGERGTPAENYCTNLYTDEPVCFPQKQSDLMPCDVPICSEFH